MFKFGSEAMFHQFTKFTLLPNLIDSIHDTLTPFDIKLLLPSLSAIGVNFTGIRSCGKPKYIFNAL